MIWAFGIITVIYAILLLFLLFGFYRVPEQQSRMAEAVVSFSIIVPFRNEAEALSFLLSSFKRLKYPKNLFEIIFVNDSSEDLSEDICRKFMEETPELKMSLLQSQRSTGSPKKDALQTGIEAAGGTYILTTDADCEVPPTWLMAYNNFIRETPVDLVAGPVNIRSGKSLLTRFQEIDFFSLQAASMGGFGVDLPFMCNGANLCFRKEQFLKVEGYQGNESIASGDDIFLLEKFVSHGMKVAFLKDSAASVITTAQQSIKSLFMQRIRWAAKTSSYSEIFPKAVGLSVFLMNLLLVAGVILVAAGAVEKQYLLLAFLVKFNLDFALIYRGAQFFGRENSMRDYFWVSILYPFFCCGVVFISGFTSYQWKGRKFRK